MELDKKNREYLKIPLHSVNLMKIVNFNSVQINLIQIIKMGKIYLKVFHHFLFNLVFLIFIIVEVKNIKTNFKSTKIKKEIMYKDT